MPCFMSIFPPYICTPHASYTSVCSPYTIFSPYVTGTWWASVHPICLGFFWGATVHLWGISMSFITSICLSSHTSCSPSLLVASLLDWMPMDVFCASCCCSFLCSVFIMSQASTTMAMNTTPPVTVVCCGMSSHLSAVTMGPSMMELPVTSGQHNVVLPLLPTPRHSGGVVGLATVLQQQPPSQYLPNMASLNKRNRSGTPGATLWHGSLT